LRSVPDARYKIVTVDPGDLATFCRRDRDPERFSAASTYHAVNGREQRTQQSVRNYHFCSTRGVSVVRCYSDRAIDTACRFSGIRNLLKASWMETRYVGCVASLTGAMSRPLALRFIYFFIVHIDFSNT
jgi:hypothetical protein